MKHKTLYYGGHIITCNLRDDIAEAMVIEDSKILYVGDYVTAHYLTDADTEIIHIGGRAIMPTFTDSMCRFFPQRSLSVFDAKTQIESLWENAIPHGFTCFCDDGNGGEKGISAFQIFLGEGGKIPLRCLSLIDDDPTHPEGTFATCLSACGIRTGLGDKQYKIGFVRMAVTAPNEENFSLNTPFAMFLNHLFLSGISVQFEPKSKAEAQYALWCAYCLQDRASPLPPVRILLPFAIDEPVLSLASKTKCHVVLPAKSLFSPTPSPTDMPPDPKSFLDADIPFSFAFFHTEKSAYSPMDVISKLVYGNDSSFSQNSTFTIPLKEALRAITLYGAMGALQDDVFGSLEWGKSADFLLLSASPFGASKRELEAIRPLRVVLGGKVVYDTTPLPKPVHAVYVPTEA